jgi:hypothetical protein
MDRGRISIDAGDGSDTQDGDDDAALQFEGKSQLARELRGLPERQKALLNLDDWLLELVDGIVTVVINLTEAPDGTSLQERIAAAVAPLPSLEAPNEEFAAKLEYWTARLEKLDPHSIPKWVKRLSRDGNWKRFLRKLIGAAQYDRLVQALVSDCAVIAKGLRSLMHHLEPFAVAFDDIIGVLTPDQVQEVWDLPGGVTRSSLRMVLQLDQAIENLIASNLDLSWD